MTQMTTDEAREFRGAHDALARALTRMTKNDLIARRAAYLRAENIISYGGPSSKDELVRDLLEHYYPLARLNEAGHVLYHKPGENWSACEHCGPAIGSTRACPDCGQPQHYTGVEYGWAHDALVDTWHCADPRKAGACADDFVAAASLAPDELTDEA